LLGYLRDFQSLIEPFLRLLQHLRGQHHCPPLWSRKPESLIPRYGNGYRTDWTKLLTPGELVSVSGCMEKPHCRPYAGCYTTDRCRAPYS
jgi:hypothetical protein